MKIKISTWLRPPATIVHMRTAWSMSYREGRGVGGGRAYISATEDLRGVFQAGEAVDEGMRP
jgi:hypothetical protein